MTSWFVSTTRSAPGSHYGVEWLLVPCRTEDEAKAFASQALARGLRIEAGTVPGIEPHVRIGWQAAHHWAQSSNADFIMSLRQRLAAFAA